MRTLCVSNFINIQIDRYSNSSLQTFVRISLSLKSSSMQTYKFSYFLQLFSDIQISQISDTWIYELSSSFKRPNSRSFEFRLTISNARDLEDCQFQKVYATLRIFIFRLDKNKKQHLFLPRSQISNVIQASVHFQEGGVVRAVGKSINRHRAKSMESTRVGSLNYECFFQWIRPRTCETSTSLTVAMNYSPRLLSLPLCRRIVSDTLNF